MALVTTYSRYLGEATPAGAIAELARALSLESRLLAVGEAAASLRSAPEKWSCKEVLGHLIDSAGNNLQRFVRAQIPAHLTEGVLRLPSYSQDDWVRVQGYRDRSWEDLVVLWVALNLHLLHVVKRMEPSRLGTLCVLGDREAVTLEHLVVDYVGHLKHHMTQILKG